MFDNTTSFLAVISLNIKYSLIVRLLNRQALTILLVCKILCNIYYMRGFLL